MSSAADAMDDQPGGRDGRDESSDISMDTDGSGRSANLRAALQFVNTVARRRYREQRFTVDNVSVEEVEKLTHELEYYTPPDAPGPIYSYTRISYDAAKSRLVLETRPSIICESLPMFTARSIRDAAGEIVRQQLVQAGGEDPGDEAIFVNWHMPSASYPFEGRWKGSLREPDEMIGYASDVEMVSDRLMIEGGARCDYASLVDIMKLWLYGSGDDRCRLCLLVTFDEQPRFVMPDVDEVDVAWDWRSAVKEFEKDVADGLLRSQTDTSDKELMRQPIEYMGHMWLGKLRSWKVETFRKDRDTHNIYVDRQINILPFLEQAHEYPQSYTEYIDLGICFGDIAYHSDLQRWGNAAATPVPMKIETKMLMLDTDSALFRTAVARFTEYNRRKAGL